jgi:hypothetical protein
VPSFYRAPSDSDDPSSETYILRSWGLTGRNVVLLLPLFVGPYWLISDYWNDQLTWATWVFSGFVIAIGALGLAYVCTPVELVADEQGFRWRQFGWRKTIRWSEIEEVGVGKNRHLEGFDHLAARLVRRVGGAGLIGVNLRPGCREPGVLAYRRGFTGFDLSFTNSFNVATEAVAAELRRRLEVSRGA